MNENEDIIIRKAEVNEYWKAGRLMAEVYSRLEGFPMRLAIVGDFSDLKGKSLRDFIRWSLRLSEAFI